MLYCYIKAINTSNYYLDKYNQIKLKNCNHMGVILKNLWTDSVGSFTREDKKKTLKVLKQKSVNPEERNKKQTKRESLEHFHSITGIYLNYLRAIWTAG